MHRHVANALLTGAVAVCAGWPAVLESRNPQPSGAGSSYSVVEVCSLVPLAEVKKLAPWPPHMDAFAKAEEEAIGTRGSSCNYPTVHVQVMAFRQQTIDAARKSGRLEPVSGIGDEAYVRNNAGRYAELFARVGQHLLTVQLNIDDTQTFDKVRPALLELGKTLASRLK